MWLVSRLNQGRRRSPRTERIDIDCSDLPVLLRQTIEIVIGDYLDSFAEPLSSEIERCFSTELSDIASNFAPDKSFTISIGSTKHGFELKLKATGRKLVVTDKSVNLTAARYKVYSRYPLRYFDVYEGGTWPPSSLIEFLSESAVRFIQGAASSSHYLPASRTGLIQSYKVLASSIVRQSSLAEIVKPGGPRLTGVVADFIGRVLELDENQETTDKIRSISNFLQSEVIHGSVSLVSGKIGQSEIYYTRDGKRFELHKTSSMVSELAPIILFIRHLTRPDSLLIIEEPESHLHPGVQRPLARAFARLLGQDVGLILTTHSDYFLQQLSHLMQLGALSPKQRVRLGYADDDVIPTSAVGAYLFDTSGPELGSVVKELSVTEAEGIPDDELTDVGVALYNEMVNLERAAARNESRTE